MKLYADLPARRTAQVLADLGVVAWVYLWVRLGMYVHDATMGLATPGRRLQETGTSYTDQVNSAADRVADIPLVGDDLRDPIASLGGVGDRITGAGTDLVEAVEKVATLLGWVTAVIPISMVVLVWVVLRGLFVRRATAAQKFIDGAPDLDLFALRAMANQPMSRIGRISSDPVGAWRAKDPEVIRQLALLELRGSGLRPPETRPELSRA